MTAIGFIGVTLMILAVISLVCKGILYLVKKFDCEHEYYVIEDTADYIIVRCFKCNEKLKIKWKYGNKRNENRGA